MALAKALQRKDTSTRFFKIISLIVSIEYVYLQLANLH